jgi:hypothetical protein
MTPGLRLRVAVAAEDTEVLQSVVGVVPVDVIELQRERLAPPLRQPAALATGLLETLANEPPAKLRRGDCRTLDQHFLERTRPTLGELLPLAPPLTMKCEVSRPSALMRPAIQR